MSVAGWAHAQGAADDRHVRAGVLRAGGRGTDERRRRTEVALRLKALADPARVKIVSYLFSSTAGEEISGDLAAALGLSESTVSHHLTQLRKAGLVESGPARHERVPPGATATRCVALCTVLDPNCCT